MIIAGVDEVGRGPLVGNVVAAAVILPKEHGILGLADSKKLTEKKRQELFIIIQERAIAYAIGQATPKEIDKINILQASLLAMSRAIQDLCVKPDKVLIDGNHLPKNIDYKMEAIIKGDSKFECISAASILAKVVRDEQMLELDAKYPEYGFAKHKGYPTKAHLEAIKERGILDSSYRKTFGPVARLLASATVSD